jgi:hypothetical protein
LDSGPCIDPFKKTKLLLRAIALVAFSLECLTTVCTSLAPYFAVGDVLELSDLASKLLRGKRQTRIIEKRRPQEDGFH